MILTIELVPVSSWGKNLRNKLTPYYWQQISQEIQKISQFTCEICNRTKGEEVTRLHCHEVWEYDFINSIQKLVGLQVLCFECHSGKHLGFSSFHREIDEESIKNHFLKINKISEKEFLEYFNHQLDIFEIASNIDWTIDYSEWDYLIEDKETSMDFTNKQISDIYSYIKHQENMTNEEIYEELYCTNKILKTAFLKYLREAKKLLRQEQTSGEIANLNIMLIYNYLKSNSKATNKELFYNLYNTSIIKKSDFDRYTSAARKRIKQEHIKKIFEIN